MIFMIIGLIVAVIATVLFGIMYVHNEGFELIGAVAFGIAAIVFAVVIPYNWVEARTNKALMQSHLENPTNYTYTQLAEHNELVAKLGVWQGTIFSFYNDTNLETIDIDSVSQKVVVEPKMEK